VSFLARGFHVMAPLHGRRPPIYRASERPIYFSMYSQRTVPDTFALSGDPVNRVRQALEIARHQIRVAWADADWRLEDVLIDGEEAIADQLARIDAALADAEADAEESGEAERQRRAYYSRYQAA
jgi:hypothetical protein